MKVADLPKALTLAKALDDAQKRLAMVKAWETGDVSVFVSLDNKSVMVCGDSAFDKLRRTLESLIDSEVRDLEAELRTFGVYE